MHHPPHDLVTVQAHTIDLFELTDVDQTEWTVDASSIFADTDQMRKIKLNSMGSRAAPSIFDLRIICAGRNISIG